jgi:hypothetical protein
MLSLAPMTALVRCVCEIDGMVEGQVWAENDNRAHVLTGQPFWLGPPSSFCHSLSCAV